MNGRLFLTGKTNEISQIRYALMTGFDPDGEPIYTRGIIESAEECELLQSILEPLHPVPHSITSVTMGEVMIRLVDRREITLRPVYRPSLDAYRDLYFVGECQYPMPTKLAELLERWRKKTPGSI